MHILGNSLENSHFERHWLMKAISLSSPPMSPSWDMISITQAWAMSLSRVASHSRVIFSFDFGLGSFNFATTCPHPWIMLHFNASISSFTKCWRKNILGFREKWKSKMTAYLFHEDDDKTFELKFLLLESSLTIISAFSKQYPTVVNKKTENVRRLKL